MLRRKSLPFAGRPSQRETSDGWRREDETSAPLPPAPADLRPAFQVSFFLSFTTELARASVSTFASLALASDVPFLCRGYSHSGGGVVSMNSRWIRIGVAAAAAALFTTGFVLAQQSTTDDGKRKIKSKISPAY